MWLPHDSILMRLNIGVCKTAALHGFDREPMVHGILHWAGSHGRLLVDLQSRLRSKTGQFLRGARAKQVPISLLCQLWAVYVEPIAKVLMALSRSELQKVDLVQRKLARMILGQFPHAFSIGFLGEPHCPCGG